MERTHGEGSGHDVGCFGCKLLSVQFGGVEKTSEQLMEERWERDRPAYRALRDQGYQPRQIEGCGELEARATDEWEISHHIIVDKEVQKTHLSAVKDAETYVETHQHDVAEIRDWAGVKVPEKTDA